MSVDALLKQLTTQYNAKSIDVAGINLPNVTTATAEEMVKYFYQSSTNIALLNGVDAPVKHGNDAVIFKGKAKCLNFDSATIQFIFTLKDENLILQMMISLEPVKSSWRFQQTFTSLDETLWKDLSLASNDQYSPAIVLVSEKYQDLALNVTFDKMINFYGQFNRDLEIFERASWLLNGNKQLAVGSIQGLDANGDPANSFSTVAIWEIDIVFSSTNLALFGGKKVPVAAHLVKTKATGYEISLSGIEIKSSIQLSGQEVVVSAVVWFGSSNLLPLSIVFPNGLSIPSPSELLSYFGNDSLGPSLPDKFGGGSGLHVSSIDFGISLDTKSLSYASLTLGALDNGDKLKVIPSVIEVGNLKFTFTVYSPFTQDQLRVNFTFVGELDIASTLFDVSARLPNFTIAAELQEESTIPLGDLIGKLVGANIPGLGLVVTELNMSATPKPYSQYWVQAQIDDVLAITVDSLSFAIKSINFEINHVAGGTTGILIGIVEIAGVDFNVSASHPEAGGSWLFTAEMVPEDYISLDDIFSYFFKKLDLPFFKTGITVNELKATITRPPTVDDIQQMVLPATSKVIALRAQEKKKNSYTFDGGLLWDLSVIGMNASIQANIHIEYDGDKSKNNFSGYVKAVAKWDVFGAPVTFVYRVAYVEKARKEEPNNELGIIWNGFEADYNFNTKVISFKISNWTLGELISEFIAMISQEKFTLNSPWDFLNDISLDGFEASFNTVTKNVTVEYKLSNTINLGFLQVTGFGLTKNDKGKVVIYLEGSSPLTDSDPQFKNLFDPDEGQDVQNMPDVPGKGNGFFELKYVGMGQHVSLRTEKEVHGMEDTLTSLQRVFKEPEKGGAKPVIPIMPQPAIPLPYSTLVFNESSNWLIATDFQLMKVINIGVLFNDPDLYGLMIQIGSSDDKNSSILAKLGGLKFEILYKKISDSIGVYQIELQLPDYMRQLEFGAVSVTLPVIGLDIYTNGAFKVDVGFPEGMNFSRSFTIQAFPFIGSGGFYFAMLSSATSTKVPVTEYGLFNPVIEFGFGLSLGVGKTIDKGIFSAGLSVTAIGIFEGVIGKFKPYDRSWAPVTTDYYSIKGTFGIVGKLYGSVNFAIISARVDLIVYAVIKTTIESFKAIPILLEAGVSVSLKVKINLGLFSIHINLHFSMTIKASFTIGSDTSSQAPWVTGPPAQHILEELAALPTTLINTTMKWQPLNNDVDKQDLNIYFLPTLSIAGSLSSNDQSAQYLGMFYIDGPDSQKNDTIDTSLNYLTNGVLAWSINAYINSDVDANSYRKLRAQSLTLSELEVLYCYLTNSKKVPTPIVYHNDSKTDIFTFIGSFFSGVNVHFMDRGELSASAFPAVPEMILSSWLNGEAATNGDLTPFEAINLVDGDYRSAIQTALQAMAVEYQTDAEKADEQDSDICDLVKDPDMPSASDKIALPTFIFQDYILMLAKSAVQNAIDEFKNFAHQLSDANTLESIKSEYNTMSSPTTPKLKNKVSGKAIIESNKTTELEAGTSIIIPGISYQVQVNSDGKADSFNDIAAVFNGQLDSNHQLNAASFDLNANNIIQGILVVDQVISIDGYNNYSVVAGDSLKTIQANIKKDNGDKEVSIASILTAVEKVPLPLLLKISLPNISYTTKTGDTFEKIITIFGTNATALDNSDNANTPITTKKLFTGDSIIVANLNILSVGMVLDRVNKVSNVQRIAGMSSRFFLHGLRLPMPADMSSTEGLYHLTEQQISVPTLAQNDKYSIKLEKTKADSWLSFKQGVDHTSLAVQDELDITVDNNEISRVQNITSIKLNPDTSPLPPSPLKLYKDVNPTYSVASEIKWQYPGKLVLCNNTPTDDLDAKPSIWSLSESLMNELVTNDLSGGTDINLVLKVATQNDKGTGFKRSDVKNYCWSTLVNLDIKKIQPSGGSESPILANTTDMVGADDTGIVFLQRLLTYINAHGGSDSFIDQIQLLYAPNHSGSTPTGLQSAFNGELKFGLVKANLSTETNPTNPPSDGLLELLTTQAPERNTLNKFQEFITLLWECSIVRSGGYYLYYQTSEGGKGLPDNIFDEQGVGQVSLLITYNENLSEEFLNTVVVADEIDNGKSIVYAEADAITQRIAVVPPGNVGIQATRSYPGEYKPVTPYPIPANANSTQEDIIYLNTQFNLLGYALLGSDGFNPQPQSLMPVGPTNHASQDEMEHFESGLAAEDGTKPWEYHWMLPVARFAKTYPTAPTPNNSAFPAVTGSPYAGLGELASVQLNWQDMYGNIINTLMAQPENAIITPIGYTDDLIGLDTWPSVTALYDFSCVNNKATLAIDLLFDTTRYTPSKHTGVTAEQAIKNAQVDAASYVKIYYQLLQSDVEVSYQTSLNGTHDNPAGEANPVDQNKLLNYVGTAYAYLMSVVNSSSISPPQVPYELSVAIEPTNSEDIFELTTSFTIKRTGAIDPDFSDVATVKSVTSRIKPITDKLKNLINSQEKTDDEDDSKQGMSYFAENFEEAYKDTPSAGVILKIAIGLDANDVVNGKNNKRVWVVRFDNSGQDGIHYSIDKSDVAFYSLPPLSTSIVNLKKVPIGEYKTGKPYPTSITNLNFDDVDLDKWNQQFFSAVDDLLDPQYAVPAFILDLLSEQKYYQNILDQKEIIAKGISKTVAEVVSPAEPSLFNISNAQYKLEQQILMQLSNAYNIDAIVQNPVTMQSQYTGSNNMPPASAPYVPRLYGQMVGSGVSPLAAVHAKKSFVEEKLSDQYTLSSAKIPMGNGDSWLTYAFNAIEADKHRSFKFDGMSYAISHIEHQITDVQNANDYKASSWLTFIIPISTEMTDVGEVNIPVPLRSYPTPPSITSQMQKYHGVTGTDDVTISDAKKWAYQFDYIQVEAVQDVINSQIEFNVPEGNLLESPMAELTQLQNALAQFANTYKAINKDFVASLSKINLESKEKDPDAYNAALSAMQAFSVIVTQIGDYWNPKKQNVKHFGMFGSPKYEKYKYQIGEYPATDGDASSNLVISITPDKANSEYRTLPLPFIDVPGYTTKLLTSRENSYSFYKDDHGTDKYLSYGDRGHIKDRSVEQKELDILLEQNAWSGIATTRNSQLLKDSSGNWIPVNPKFIYSTPLVKFYNKLVPLLVCDQTINIAEANQTGDRAPKNLQLAEHLFNVFTELFTSNATGMQVVKLELAYEYTLDGEAEFLAINLPVFLVSPFEFDIKTDLPIGTSPAFCPADNKGFVCNLANSITKWYQANTPSTNQAKYIFKLDVYSKTDNKLPLLKLQCLELSLNNIKGL